MVLRRSRSGNSVETEARIMEYLHAQGYPVPAVYEVADNGTDLIMERIEGPSMVEYMKKRPWKIRQQGTVLSNLHHRLHEVPPPAFLARAQVGAGNAFVHMDLHPLNVLVGPRGPVVIDWTNARRGDPLIDVALAYVLMAAGEIPSGRLEGAVLRLGRRLLLSSFVREFQWDQIAERMDQVVQWKATDPHMSRHEIAAMRKVSLRTTTPR